MSQKASPPTPVMCGYTTLSTALAAMAASTAEPPAFKTSTPALDASAWGHDTIPRNASAGGRPVVRSRSPEDARSLGLGQPDGSADLRDLPRVVVPVVIEHGADEQRQRDFVGAHELLEQRHTRLSRQVGLTEPLEVAEDVAALGIEGRRQFLD